MTIYKKVSGAWQLTTPRARIGGSGFLDRVVRVKQGGVWRQVWPFQLFGNTSPTGYRLGVGAGTVTANPGISVAGGTGSYSYSTIKLSGDPQINAANATSIGVTAQASMSGNVVYSGTFRTTATDNTSGQVTSFDWTATLTNET